MKVKIKLESSVITGGIAASVVVLHVLCFQFTVKGCEKVFHSVKGILNMLSKDSKNKVKLNTRLVTFRHL